MVVVTGATGHIGNVLVRRLLSRGEKVRVVIPPAEDLTPLDGLKVEIVEGDVRKIDSLIKAVAGSDVVYHLAGIISILPGKNELLYQVNITTPLVVNQQWFSVRMVTTAGTSGCLPFHAYISS
jgi:dihydroflavonol-4-reductase